MKRSISATPADYVTSILVASLKRSLVAVGFVAYMLGETRVLRNGQWVRKDRIPIGVADDGFIDGVTIPVAANTGPRFGPNQTFGVAGSNYVYTISTPGIYERLLIYGRIVVTITSGVIIRDCKVELGTSNTVSIHGILFDNPNADYTTNFIEFCEITVSSAAILSENQSSGIRGRGFTARRNKITKTVDGFEVLGKTGATERRTVVIENNYVDQLTVSTSATQADGFTHNDCLQCFGAVNLYIKWNNFHGGRTSCIILNTSVSGGYDVVLIEGNWLYGNPTGGSTINVAPGSGNDIPNLSVIKNHVDRNGFDSGQITVQIPNRKPASFGAISGTTNGIMSDWVYGPDKNFYMDNGAEVRCQLG